MKKLAALLLSILMTLSLCACGAESSAKQTYESMQYSSASVSGPAPAITADYGGFAAEEEIAVAKGARDAGNGDNSAAPEADPDKIIYSANATVETTEFDSACAGVVKLVEKLGGWIESSSVNGSNYYNKARGTVYNRSASYYLRVPSDKFEELMSQLPGLGNVPYSNTYTDNVTSQYYDVQARLTAYETQETRLLEMMEKAETVSDVITIEDRLTELRYQIESLQSTLNSWDRQVSYSSVSLSVEEVQEYTPEAAENYWKELWQSLVDGLKNALNFIKEVIVFLVGALPVLVVLGLLAWAVAAIVKKRCKARKARKAIKQAEEENSGKPAEK